MKYTRQYSLCNCDHFHDIEHWRDNRLCCYTWFQTFSTYIYPSFYICLRFNSLFVNCQGAKETLVFYTRPQFEKIHKKKIRYDKLVIARRIVTLLSVAHLKFFTLSPQPCISSSHCNKATLRLNNIWVQHSVNTVFLRLQPTINAKSFFQTLFSSPMFWSGVTV